MYFVEVKTQNLKDISNTRTKHELVAVKLLFPWG